MNYLELTFTINPFNQDIREILTAELGEIGFESFVETDIELQAFIQEANFDETFLKTLQILQDENFKISYKIEKIENQNWNETWEKNYFKALHIANKCVIRSSFHTDYPKSKYEIIIDPKMAFGTGHHETTSLMIEEILNLDVKNKRILDMGCGTGILAILSSMLGSEKIWAIDNDEWSYKNTIENLKLNNISNIEVFHGDKNNLKGEKFEIIFANINKNILLADINQYSKSLETGGLLLLSGFYTEDYDDLNKILKQNELTFISKRINNNWLMMTYKKS
ncbi:MAG: 50S ribosomal protein L11 methyltransferase [Bacteroidales bacterium]|nr:50S ribosomal protein L11 methyltransferase [Bacteroidales bacterium]MBN2758398.1 50S ribosomal protein L11 methyltransferase [Bacteroidales bacterium]